MLWKDKNIRVFGDVMLDHYLIGTADRVSPEAAVLIVNKKGDRYVPGGAANTAANVATLGAKVQLYGLTGNDPQRDLLLRELEALGVDHENVIADSYRPTTSKTRVLAVNHQVCRIDNESTEANSDNLENTLLLQLAKRPLPAALVISDYGKGVVTAKSLSYILPFYAAEGVPVIIGPKPREGIEYVGGFLTVPNKKEAAMLTGRSIRTLDDVFQAGRLLQHKLESNILITLGEDGMALFEKGAEPYHLPTVAKQVSDVSGAGDTVVATLAIALAAKVPLREAVVLANKAAGIKVTKSGTATVNYEELFQST